MQFNDVTNRNGIIQAIERESKLGLGTVSDNAAPDYYLDYFTMKINEWLHIVQHWIQEVNDEWPYDDDNNTGSIPEVYNFSADTQIYTLDNDITKIRKVEFHDATKNASKGWSDADYYYESDRIEDLYGQDSGSPSKYFMQGRNLIVDVPVDITKTDKYRITYDRRGTEFVVSDTTKEPGFEKRFHWLVVYGPVMDWAIGRNPDIFQKCRLKVFGGGEGDPGALKTMLQEHYMNQNRNIIYKIGRESKNYD